MELSVGSFLDGGVILGNARNGNGVEGTVFFSNWVGSVMSLEGYFWEAKMWETLLEFWALHFFLSSSRL